MAVIEGEAAAGGVGVERATLERSQDRALDHLADLGLGHGFGCAGAFRHGGDIAIIPERKKPLPAEAERGMTTQAAWLRAVCPGLAQF